MEEGRRREGGGKEEGMENNRRTERGCRARSFEACHTAAASGVMARSLFRSKRSCLCTHIHTHTHTHAHTRTPVSLPEASFTPSTLFLSPATSSKFHLFSLKRDLSRSLALSLSLSRSLSQSLSPSSARALEAKETYYRGKRDLL